jgi:hypothetical protein
MWAAKFREETPRKGGGFAIKDRNTALQQYAETRFCTQVQKANFAKIFSAESLAIFTICCPIFRQKRTISVLVRRNNSHFLTLFRGFTGLSQARNKRFAGIP